MTDVYFFNDYQKLIKVVTQDYLFQVTQEREITSDKSELMNDTLTVVTKYDEKINEAGFMAVRENESSFSLYKITSISDSQDQLSFTGVNFAADELDSYIVKDLRPKNEKFEDFAIRLLDVTEGDWIVSSVSQTLKSVSGTFYYISVKEALKTLQSIGCEVTFRISIEGSKIVGKYIDFYDAIGVESNTRYEYGSNALEVVKEVSKNNIYTSLIGRGKGEEVGDGYGRRLEFTDVSWTSPLSKPKGQNWLEDKEMTAKFGIPTKNGGMRKREKVVIFEDIEDAEELLQATYEALVETNRPLVQFRSKIIGTEKIGNTVTIHRYDRNYHYKTRVFQTKVDLLTGQGEMSIGDQLTRSITRQTSSIQNGLSTLDQKKMTFYQSTEIGKYQDDIMRGAGKNGGSIYLVNGIEAGVSNSRESYEQVFMDGPKIELSEHFMIQNSEGISFKKCKKGEWTTVQDVHNGSSKTAWTIESIFNADFIQAGTLSAINIEGVNIYGSKIETINDGQYGMLRMQNGTIQFFDKKGKSFGLLTITDLEKPSILLQHNDGSFFMDEDSATITHSKMINLNAPKVLVNGVSINTGSGGSGNGNGSWDGTYPSSVTSDRDKRYWQIWALAVLNGMTKAAAAALCGNAQGESDANPKADEANGEKGFGYGIWQWTDSNGQLSGRDYMISLMNKAGITEDPDTTEAQFKLMMWHAENGQWIATNDYPYSFGQFKQLNNVATATTAFERNFERPATTHPERVDYANDWYNKFQGLEVTTSGAWVNPLHNVSYTATQEWSNIQDDGKMHGGIDLAPNGGATPPIYAARTGTVQQVVYNDEVGGNYIIVKHSDDYWTYYGHLASVNVKQGDNVSTSSVLGICGATGKATGVHLHFEVWKGGEWQRINPRDVIKF